jgi:hypothetical protein
MTVTETAGLGDGLDGALADEPQDVDTTATATTLASAASGLTACL